MHHIHQSNNGTIKIWKNNFWQLKTTDLSQMSIQSLAPSPLNTALSIAPSPSPTLLFFALWLELE